VRLGGYGAIMMIGTLVAYRLTVGGGAVSDTDAARGAVVALTTFVFFQLFNLQNARLPDHTAISRHTLRNWRLWAASVSVLVLQVVAMTWDWSQQVFTGRDEAAELGPADWALAAGLAASILVIEEARKLIRRVRNDA